MIAPLGAPIEDALPASGAGPFPAAPPRGCPRKPAFLAVRPKIKVGARGAHGVPVTGPSVVPISTTIGLTTAPPVRGAALAASSR